MLKRLFFIHFLLLFCLSFNLIYAQEATLLSPQLFLRGMQLPAGTRYTAAFIKPQPDMPLRNISVEITLPADAIFTEMLVSKQVQFDVIRRNAAGQLTLIWQISRVDGAAPLDSFSFTLAKPIETPLEFYMFWQDENGQSFEENFIEIPSLITATETAANFTPTSEQFAFVGNTGIQVAANLNTELNFQILDANFNPPAEFGSVWWCSLLNLEGLLADSSAMVIVPLRRPVAPFLELFLFQQQPDGSWLALEDKAVVTADGQYAMYRHIGGLIATGGDEEIKQDTVTAAEAGVVNPEVIVVEPIVPVEQAQPVVTVQSEVPLEPTTVSNDGTSNTITLPEATLPPTTVSNDGTSNTITLPETNPTRGIPPTTTTGDVNDGTSNTIIVGEATSDPQATSLVSPGRRTTPTDVPTNAPVVVFTPTDVPTNAPVVVFTPTDVPTNAPVVVFTPTDVPTNAPVVVFTPTDVPTNAPVVVFTPTDLPAALPTATTGAPTATPTALIVSTFTPPRLGVNPSPVEVFLNAEGEFVQCQAVQLQCAIVKRDPGTRLTP
ncbi:hypothetical protein MASR2M15_06800 [Anaerolineales bacterium]